MFPIQTPILCPAAAYQSTSWGDDSNRLDTTSLPPNIDPATADRVLSAYFADPDSTLSQVADRLAYSPPGPTPRPTALPTKTIALILASPYAQNLIALIDRLTEQRARIIAAEARVHAIHITRRIAATSPNLETARRAANALLNFKTFSIAPRVVASHAEALARSRAPRSMPSVPHAASTPQSPCAPPRAAAPSPRPVLAPPAAAPAQPAGASPSSPRLPTPRAAAAPESIPELPTDFTDLIERLAHSKAAALLASAGSARARDAPLSRSAA